MKNMAAMSVAIMTRLAREPVKPKRDLIFAGVADEEAGCRHGSLWLCENPGRGLGLGDSNLDGSRPPLHWHIVFAP
jgi:acetylornithine deacetylase/succinyl-diaminopimelate desuccinylase-like protein